MNSFNFLYLNTLLGHEDGYALDSQWKWLVSKYFDSIYLQSVHVIDSLLIILEYINQYHYLEIHWTTIYTHPSFMCVADKFEKDFFLNAAEVDILMRQHGLPCNISFRSSCITC